MHSFIMHVKDVITPSKKNATSVHRSKWNIFEIQVDAWCDSFGIVTIFDIICPYPEYKHNIPFVLNQIQPHKWHQIDSSIQCKGIENEQMGAFICLNSFIEQNDDEYLWEHFCVCICLYVCVRVYRSWILNNIRRTNKQHPTHYMTWC